MSQVNCLNPKIIINKSYHVNKVDFSRDWKVFIRGKESKCVPYPNKASIQLDEVDDCFYLNTRTGEMIPVYLVVPCQKCILCRDKKAVDWATRITCEGNYHINCPWWITLTYNHLALPGDGLVKRDLQNFFKRLRERVSRVVSEDLRLRFVAVGEYGSDYHRAHYHAIIYGLPCLSAKEILHHIENAWSTRISFKRYKEIKEKYGLRADDYMFIRKDINGKSLYYLRLGFAYVKPAHDNTPLYLAKYIFKPEINTPEGKNPNFFLASRKNGIGYQYIVEFCKYHRQNPHVTKIDFMNKHTGKMCHFAMPGYFKDYWFPTPSKLIPNEVRQSWNLFSSLLDDFNVYRQYLLKHGSVDMADDVNSMLNDLNNKYPFWRKLRDNHLSDINVYRDWIRECTYKVPLPGYHYIDMFGFGAPVPNFTEEMTMTPNEYAKVKMIQSYSLMLMEYEYIMSLEFDTNEMLQCLTLRDKFKGAVTQKLLNKPPLNPIDAAYKLKKRYELAKHKQYQ